MSVVSSTVHRLRSYARRTGPVWEPLVYLVAAFMVMSVLSAALTKGVMKEALHLPSKMNVSHYMVLSEAVMGACALFALGVTTWHKDGKPFARTAFSTDAPHFKLFWIGCAVGAVNLSVPVMMMAVPGWFRASLSPIEDIVRSLVEGSVCMFFVGVFEETMFRGIFFEFVEQALGTWMAVFVTSTTFGFIHLINPAATVIGALCICVEAGAMIGGALVWSRSMWMPIGVHLAWNLFQGSVWGLAVSGGPKPQVSVFHSEMVGGPWYLTGGAFGPEGSLFSFICCTITGVFFLTWAVAEDKIYPPAWETKEWKALQYDAEADEESAVCAKETSPLLA